MKPQRSNAWVFYIRTYNCSV